MKILKILGIIILVIILSLIVLFFFAKNKLARMEDKGDLAKVINEESIKFINNGNSLGLVVGIVKNGQVFLKGYGTIKKGENIAPDLTTIFELASTSKLFTTSTLQILSDHNRIDIDEKIQNILKDKVTLPTIAQNTTLQNLATHTSGFPSLPKSFIAKMTDARNPYKDLVKKDIYNYLINCEEKNPEGTFEYSNFGMGLLGHLLEIKTNRNYEQLVKETLLDPLEMKSTFINVDSPKNYKIAQGYNENNEPTPIWIDNVLTGAGSFLSNGEDMIKFIKANLTEEASTISRSLINSHRNQLNNQTGLGWLYPENIDKLMGQKSIVWHNGMAGGYSSFIAIDKTNNYGVIILSNKSVDITTFGMKLTMYARTQSWKN